MMHRIAVLASLLTVVAACAGPATAGRQAPPDLNHVAKAQILGTWLLQMSGPDSGGFFATHPGTAERIEAVRKMP